MASIRFFIAGVKHRPAADIQRAIADGLAEGSKLNLTPEPTNQYDPNAIAVFHYGVMIGYVPKVQQANVRGATTATMDAFDLNAPAYERFPILVESVGDAPIMPPRRPSREAPPATRDAAVELEIVAAPYAIESIDATEKARKYRDELIAQARAKTGIPDPEGAKAAANLLQEMTRFTRTIEETRETVKRPLLEAGRKIDATAKTLVLDVEAEAKRLGSLIGAFQESQKKLEEENRRRAYEEQERIRKEAEDRERQIREEKEAARRQLNDARNKAVADIDPTVAPADYADLTSDQFAETMKAVRTAKKAREQAEAAAARATSEKAKETAARKAQEARDAEIQRQKDAADLAERQRKEREAREAQEEQKRWDEAALKSAQAAEVVTAPTNKITGIAVGSEIKFEVTDIVALYEAAPYLVKLEANTSSIKAALKQLSPGQTLPGVRHWKEAKTVVRQ
jgi:hypothetical protein